MKTFAAYLASERVSSKKVAPKRSSLPSASIPEPG